MPLRILGLLLFSLSLCLSANEIVVQLSPKQRQLLLSLEKDASKIGSQSDHRLPPLERKFKTICTISSFLELGDEFMADNEARKKTAKTADELKQLNEIEKLTNTRLNELRQELIDTATGVTENEFFHSDKQAESNLSEEVKALLSPLFGEFENITAWPRELSKLKALKTKYEEQQNASTRALKNVRELKQLLGDKLKNTRPEEAASLVKTLERLESTESLWAGRNTNSKNQLNIINIRIKEGEADAPTIGEIITMVFHKIWEKLGLNLLLSFLIFSGTLFFLRSLYRLILRFSPLHTQSGERNARRHAVAHLIDLSSFYISLIIAACAVLTTLYIRGDGLLLTIFIMMLAWMGWSLRNEIPAYISRSRLMLNLGSLRVGERVQYQGLSWRVESINFFCEFKNPSLEGGRLRIPLKEALSLVSRPILPGESWFPTQKGDCYSLPTGERGVILRQTVEQICVDLFVGGTRTYTPTQFIALSPEVLSQGFDLVTFFEMDYSHQPQITREIPELLQVRIKKALLGLLNETDIVTCMVSFNQPMSASLQLICYVKIQGSYAKQYGALKRLINRTFVETCTEQGWEISTPQITVYQK